MLRGERGSMRRAMPLASRAAEDPRAVGPVLLLMGVQQQELLELLLLLLHDGVHLSSPPSFQSPLNSPRP